MAFNKQIKWQVLLALGLIARLILLFAFPCLSDDIYRFIWDGHLIHNAVHPLSYTPSQIINAVMTADSFLDNLYPLLNSKDYYTIYPPLHQIVFYVATMSSEWPLELSSGLIKAILLACELGTISFSLKLLENMSKKRALVLLYVLNPLVIVEIMGNAHFEAMMVFFIVAMLYFLSKKNYVFSGIMFSSAVATKLLPLLFLPLILVFIYKKKGIMKFVLSSAIVFLILFVPMFYTLDIANFFGSLDLYFQKFEFNAGIYYFLREIGRALTGYNQIAIIGPLMAFSALLIILYLAYKHLRHLKFEELIQFSLISFVSYLLLGTTIHPWYLILPIALSIYQLNLWIWVWSFLVVLSYSHYEGGLNEANYLLISVEYILICLVWVIEKKYPLHQMKRVLYL